MLADFVQSGESHDEFLLSRIIFVLTYEKSAGLQQVVENSQLPQVVNRRIARHATRYSSSSDSPSSPMDDSALTETCKLIFNVTHFSPDKSSAFSESVPHLFLILKNSRETPPLKQPVASVLNALLNVDSESDVWKSSAFPQSNQREVATHLVAMLSTTVKNSPERELDTLASPLASFITKIYSSAPLEVQESMARAILPTDADRKQALGKGNSLSARLLRLSISPLHPVLKEALSNLFFLLSDSDPNKFVHNVGFGYASGYLVSRGLPVPASAQSDVDASGAPINPVTGQRLDTEMPDDLPPMTDEEKEREAERLFVLFERFVHSSVIIHIC
jgi:hypothetical protein